jgi:hypothetical protein
VLGAGLAQLHAHVDEPRREAQAISIDRFHFPRGRREIAPDRGDLLPLDEEIAAGIEPAFGIQ